MSCVHSPVFGLTKFDKWCTHYHCLTFHMQNVAKNAKITRKIPSSAYAGLARCFLSWTADDYENVGHCSEEWDFRFCCSSMLLGRKKIR